MTYLEKLIASVQHSGSVLCVGLDPRPSMIPASILERTETTEQAVEQFCVDIIESTYDFCCAYKPNVAFFESLGPKGLEVFGRVLDRIPKDRVTIADIKRGDIGSTAEHYKQAWFDKLDVDAVTLNPLMGFDTLDPWLQEESRALYSLVLTSNPGSHDLLMRRFEGRLSLAEFIADQLSKKAHTSKTHIGMVIGATHPSDLDRILNSYPEASLLIPGVGSQGGNPADLVPILTAHKGVPVISASRSIIFAGNTQTNWQDHVARSARSMKEELKPFGKRYIAS